MRRSQLIEKAEGQGAITNAEPEPVAVRHTTVIDQWINVIQSRDGVTLKYSTRRTTQNQLLKENTGD